MAEAMKLGEGGDPHKRSVQITSSHHASAVPPQQGVVDAAHSRLRVASCSLLTSQWKDEEALWHPSGSTSTPTAPTSHRVEASSSHLF